MNRLRQIIPVLLACTFCTQAKRALAASAEDRQITFITCDCAARFQVLAVRLLPVVPAGLDEGIRTFEIELKVVDARPPKTIKDSIRLYVQQPPASERFAPYRSEYANWFPTTQGAGFVATFNASDIRDVTKWKPLQELEPAHVWHQCTLYWDVVAAPKAQQSRLLTKVITDERLRLGATFFELMDSSDGEAFNPKEVAMATAEFLKESKIPVATRAAVIGHVNQWDDGFVNYEPEGNKSLVSASVNLALEAKAKKMPANEVENLLERLTGRFVARKPNFCLPDVDLSARKELLLLIDELKPDPGHLTPKYLVPWLKGEAVPGQPSIIRTGQRDSSWDEKRPRYDNVQIPELAPLPRLVGSDPDENNSDQNPTQAPSVENARWHWWAVGTAVLVIALLAVAFLTRRKGS